MGRGAFFASLTPSHGPRQGVVGRHRGSPCPPRVSVVAAPPVVEAVLSAFLSASPRRRRGGSRSSSCQSAGPPPSRALHLPVSLFLEGCLCSRFSRLEGGEAERVQPRRVGGGRREGREEGKQEEEAEEKGGGGKTSSRGPRTRRLLGGS